MKIERLENFKRKLAAMAPAAKEEIRVAIGQSADEIVDLMRRLVPVDEGKLKASIGWTWGAPPEGSTVLASSSRSAAGEAGLVATIFAGDRSTIVTNARGVQFQNALLQEFGVRGRRAQPFFYPSWRLGKKRVTSRIVRATNKAAKKVAASG